MPFYRDTDATVRNWYDNATILRDNAACLYILQQLQPRDLYAARFLGGPVYVNVAPQPPINNEFLNRAPVNSSHYA